MRASNNRLYICINNVRVLFQFIHVYEYKREENKKKKKESKNIIFL
jgi:hypothetical protein